MGTNPHTTRAGASTGRDRERHMKVIRTRVELTGHAGGPAQIRRRQDQRSCARLSDLGGEFPS
jgi:hypothetical protein